MGLNRPPMLLLLIVLMASIAEKPCVAEGRTLSLMSHQGYSKVFATLGIVCKCCDENGVACTSTWTGSCSNLQCFPWKSH